MADLNSDVGRVDATGDNFMFRLHSTRGQMPVLQLEEATAHHLACTEFIYASSASIITGLN